MVFVVKLVNKNKQIGKKDLGLTSARSESNDSQTCYDRSPDRKQKTHEPAPKF